MTTIAPGSVAGPTGSVTQTSPTTSAGGCCCSRAASASGASKGVEQLGAGAQSTALPVAPPVPGTIPASASKPPRTTRPATAATPAAGGGGADAGAKVMGPPPRGELGGSNVGLKVGGKVSWYGGPNDKEDNDKPALAGATNKEPGIAVMNQATLGGWWRIKLWDGRSITIRQTDIGPARWTGKALDFNYTAVKQLGYTEGSFPTGKVAQAVYLGKDR